MSKVWRAARAAYLQRFVQLSHVFLFRSDQVTDRDVETAFRGLHVKILTECDKCSFLW